MAATTHFKGSRFFFVSPCIRIFVKIRKVRAIFFGTSSVYLQIMNTFCRLQVKPQNTHTEGQRVHLLFLVKKKKTWRKRRSKLIKNVALDIANELPRTKSSYCLLNEVLSHTTNSCTLFW